MKSKFIGCCLSIIILMGCGKGSASSTDEDKLAVVSVNGQTLYKTDLQNIVPSNLVAEDSIKIAQEYIQKWLNDQLLYNKAKQNIINQMEIDELVENYKKSLIINSYQESLFKEYFSKHVSEKEMTDFYEQHKEQFNLKDNIIKGLYLKVPLKSPQLNNCKKWYLQTNDAAIENIEKNTLQNAIGYEYFYDRWINLSELMDNIPYTVSNADQFLKSNKNLEVQDSSFVYLLNIKEYRLAGTEAPFDYAKESMSQIFKEKKKEVFLKQIEKDLYETAVANGEIKFYGK